MSYCVNPECRQPQNYSTAKFCLNCGSHLLLRQRYRPIEPLGKGGFGKTFLAVDEDLPSQPRCALKQFQFYDRDPEIFQKALELFRQEAMRLNWPTYNSATALSQLKFSQQAPQEHLPSRSWVGGVQWLRHLDAISTRLTQCSNISAR